MENGIDSHGRIVHHSDAWGQNKFYCPYCTEEVIVRRGNGACFAHKIIKNRTPLQRACPEYYENSSYRKISNQLDRLYINNGGVPLYLYNSGEKFELRAYFPNLSEVRMKQLVENKTKLVINNKTHYYVENLNYYTVDYIQDWIDVKIIPTTAHEEIKRKWLWGIRGIDIDKDIYHANSEGGYRLAIKANMYVDKKYRIMFLNKAPTIEGIVFDLKGQIRLKENSWTSNFNVYEMEIVQFTESARQFVEVRGYHLFQKASQLTPIWPPSVARGNELIFDSENAWFYHSSDNAEEYLYEVQNQALRRIPRGKVIKVTNLSKSIEKTLVVSNIPFQDEERSEGANEIRYMLQHRNSLNDKEEMIPEIVVKDSDGKQLDLADKEEVLPQDGRIFITTNLAIDILLKKDSYILFSAKNQLEELRYGKNISIDCKGFGTANYDFERLSDHSRQKQEINWKEAYTHLYKCSGATMRPSYSNKYLLQLMKGHLNRESRKTYELIYKWVQQEKVPVRAQFYLEYILKRWFRQ